MSKPAKDVAFPDDWILVDDWDGEFMEEPQSVVELLSRRSTGTKVRGGSGR